MRKLRILVIITAILLCQGNTFVIDPAKNAVWHNEKGLFYLDMKYYEAAIREFQLAVLLNPDSEASAFFYNNLGKAFYKVGYYENAEINFNKAIELKPYYLEFYENLIKTYEKKNILNKIAERHNKLIVENPNNLQSYILLGLIHKNYGNNDYAAMYLNKFIQLAPEFGITDQIRTIVRNLKEKDKTY